MSAIIRNLLELLAGHHRNNGSGNFSFREFFCSISFNSILICSEKQEGVDYQSPEDAYAFGRLLVFMLANWSFAWKLNYFPMPQVERYPLYNKDYIILTILYL